MLRCQVICADGCFALSSPQSYPPRNLEEAAQVVCAAPQSLTSSMNKVVK